MSTENSTNCVYVHIHTKHHNMSIQGSTNCVYVCASPKINNISIWDSTNIKQIKQKHVKYFYHIKRYSVLIKNHIGGKTLMQTNKW